MGIKFRQIGDVPNGYNKINASFSGASLTVEGVTEIQGVIQSVDSNISVSGIAVGWRYVVSTILGTLSFETIPVAEIITDDQVHTPTPIYSNLYKGYYSSVNPEKRIIAIAFFDGTNITEVICYGNGTNKNDDEWFSSEDSSIGVFTPGDRFQFVETFSRTRGTNISCQDNGAGNTDASGFRITVNNNGILTINFEIIQTAPGDSYINKNGNFFWVSSGQSIVIVQVNQTVSLKTRVTSGDYFVTHINTSGGATFFYRGMNLTFEEG